MIIIMHTYSAKLILIHEPLVLFAKQYDILQIQLIIIIIMHIFSEKVKLYLISSVTCFLATTKMFRLKYYYQNYAYILIETHTNSMNSFITYVLSFLKKCSVREIRV